jgi:hypothetical protein
VRTSDPHGGPRHQQSTARLSESERGNGDRRYSVAGRIETRDRPCLFERDPNAAVTPCNRDVIPAARFGRSDSGTRNYLVLGRVDARDARSTQARDPHRPGRYSHPGGLLAYRNPRDDCVRPRIDPRNHIGRRLDHPDRVGADGDLTRAQRSRNFAHPQRDSRDHDIPLRIDPVKRPAVVLHCPHATQTGGQDTRSMRNPDRRDHPRTFWNCVTRDTTGTIANAPKPRTTSQLAPRAHTEVLLQRPPILCRPPS